MGDSLQTYDRSGKKVVVDENRHTTGAVEKLCGTRQQIINNTQYIHLGNVSKNQCQQKHFFFLNTSLYLEKTLISEVSKDKNQFSESWFTTNMLFYIFVRDYIVFLKHYI